jgi:hypothetical protein
LSCFYPTYIGKTETFNLKTNGNLIKNQQEAKGRSTGKPTGSQQKTNGQPTGFANPLVAKLKAIVNPFMSHWCCNSRRLYFN